jgi:hypothetical protein
MPLASLRATSLWRKAARKLRAVTGLSSDTPYYYYYSSTGGEAGVSAGFGNATLVFVRAIPTGDGIIRGKGGETGWEHRAGDTGIYAKYGGTAGARYLITAADVGKLLVLVSRITAIPGVIETIVNRVSLPTVACAEYVVSSAPYGIGGAIMTPANGLDFVASLDFRGLPTTAQLVALCDAILTLGNVPTSFTGATTTHRHSLIDALGSTVVVDGQAAPTTLADTITGAGADLLTATAFGAATVPLTVSEPKVSEGRQSVGLTGFSTTSFLESTGLGIQGSATAFTMAMVMRAALPVTAYEHVVTCTNADVTAGFDFYMNGYAQTLVFRGVGLGTLTVCKLSELYADTLVVQTFDGAAWRTFVNGVQTGSYAGSTFTRNTQRNMRLGIDAGTAYPAGSSVLGAVAGCDQALTAAEIAAMHLNWRKSGRLALPSGKTNPHQYDFALDILAAGGDVPATFLDRAGTDHLICYGGLRRDAGGGIRDFTANDQLVAKVGVRGIASGFWAECLIIPRVGAADARVMGTTTSYLGGWSIYSWGTAVFTNWGDGAALKGNGAVTVTAGALTHVAIRYTGSGLELWVNGVLGNTVAGGFVADVGGVFYLGAAGASGQTFVSGAGGHFVPTPAEMAANASAALAAGRCVGIAGKLQQRWSVVDDTAEAGGRVPALIKDRGLDTDPAVVRTSGLRVSRRRERAESFASTPLNYGARGWSVSSYFAGAMTGFGARAYDPYWVMLALIVHAKAGSLYQVLLSKTLANSSQGFNVYASGTLGTINFSSGNGSTAIVAPGYSVLDSDLQRVLVFGFQWTGTALQSFAKRARLGAEQPATAYAPYAGNLTFGRHPDTTANPSSDNVTLLGFMGGVGMLTLPEYQSAYDAYFAENDLVPVPDKTTRLYSQRRAAIANAGALAAMTDAMGSGETLAITGAPTLSPIYAHAA